MTSAARLAPGLDRRITAAGADLADARMRGVVDAPRFAEGRDARVVAPSAPLRRRPEPDAPLDTEALMGEPVRVLDEADGYAWVQLGTDGYVGYLPAPALGAADPAPTHRVRAVRTFVYPAPDLKRPPLAFLSLGAAVVEVAEPREGYVPVTGGGFVFADHLALIAAREPDPVVVAERLLGTPYLWGGRTSLGLDCSALVQLALASVGLAAPRDSDQQEAALGTPLPLAPGRAGRAGPGGLVRGDLVFWPGHVGIMRDGATLLHANGHHMAVASEPLATAERRILASTGSPIRTLRRPPGPA